MPITITVTAETEQALQALTQFYLANQAGIKNVTETAGKSHSALKQVRESSLLLREAFHQLEGTAMLLAGVRFPELAEGLMVVRAGMGSVRTISQLTGMSLDRMVPILTGLGVAVAAGAGLFLELYREMHQVETQAKETAQALGTGTTFIDQIQKLRSAGAISPKEAREFIESARFPARPEFDLERIKKVQEELMGKGLLVPGEKEGQGFLFSPAAEALMKLKDIKRQLAEFGQDEDSRIISQLADKFGELRKQVEVFGQAAVAAGKLSVNSFHELLKEVTEVETHTIAAADEKRRQAEIEKTVEILKKRREEELRAMREQEVEERREIEETIRLLERKREAELRAIQHGIESDFRASEAEKFARLRAAGFPTEGPDPRSFKDQFDAVFSRMKDLNELAVQTAQSFQNVFETAVHSISAGITGLVMGTLTWKQALMQIGDTILTSIVSAIIELGVRWAATRLAMAVAGKAAEAAGLAATAPLAAASAAIWSPAAVLATIATGGAAAVAAPGLIGFAEALTLTESVIPRAEGGPISAGMPYLVGERGPELRTFDHPGSILNARDTASMMGSKHVAIGIIDDRQRLREFLESNAGREIIFAHLRGGRLDLGFNT